MGYVPGAGQRARMVLKAAAHLTGLKKDRVLYLLRRFDFLYSKECSFINAPSFSPYIAELCDDGFLIDTVRCGGQIQYVLLSKQPDEALKLARSAEKEERDELLKDDKEDGYHAVARTVRSDEDILTEVSPGLSKALFYRHPIVKRFPPKFRAELWKVYQERAA
jgi:hypothetical protein